jgi:hemolysin activation/secretion protein
MECPASQAGDVLNLRDIEQGLENLQRLPSVQADFQIAPASAADAPPNSSDLLLKWHQQRPYRLLLQLDDGGSQATGCCRAVPHWRWTIC